MWTPPSDPVAVLSDRLTALLLRSPHLKQQLFPEGVGQSPYSVLDYHGSLVLGDKTGATAVFARTQHVQFQQDGVQAILEHFWGRGVQLSEYSTTAGSIAESFRDDGRRHLVIRLPEKMARGQTLEFSTERTMHQTFTTAEGWFELAIDHPILQLSHAVIFPKERPCKEAHLLVGEWQRPLSVIRLVDGKTLVRCDLAEPRSHTAYRICWSW
jgi:hypothetical protein